MAEGSAIDDRMTKLLWLQMLDNVEINSVMYDANVTNARTEADNEEDN